MPACWQRASILALRVWQSPFTHKLRNFQLPTFQHVPFLAYRIRRLARTLHSYTRLNIQAQQNTDMLRITITDSPTEQKWTLQGSLSGPWIALLKLNWRSKRNSRQGKSCVVDLSDLTFVDRCGEKILRAMQKEGAQFTGCRVYTKGVLESSVHRRKEFVS